MLKVERIYKSYEGQALLKGVSFEVGEHETVCLLGSSGSGKSTLLRIIAGLEPSEAGRIYWDGKDLVDMPVHKRNFGLMFQDYALFPHRTVAENVAFGLRMHAQSRNTIQASVQKALERVNLAGFEQRRVTDLSGGEQQRVALARALAPQPRLLMLDEPLGALDRTLREQLVEELRLVLRQTGVPAIYVTHDQQEAFALADRLILLHGGQVVQAGTPQEVYAHPVNTWVASFLGLTNLLIGRVVSLNPLRIETALGIFEIGQNCPQNYSVKEALRLLLRPNGVHLAPATGGINCITGRVEDVFFRGEDYRLELACSADVHLSFTVPFAVSIGETLTLQVEPEGVLCLAGADD